MDSDEDLPRPLSAVVRDAPLCCRSRSGASAGATPFIDDQRLVMLSSHGGLRDSLDSWRMTTHNPAV